MAVIARIIVVSLLTAGLGAWLGLVFFGQGSDRSGIVFVLGCLGAIVGALAGTAREIGVALRQKSSIGEKPFP